MNRSDGRKGLPGKKQRTSSHQPKTARQDALERKVVFKQVLDNPLTVAWPSIAAPTRSQVLDALLELLKGVSLYRRNLEATRQKPLKEGPVSDRWGNKPFERDPQRPPVLDHLVVGINSVTKALEEPSLTVIEDDGRERKRQRKLEKLKEQVAKDVERGPRLAETLRQTGVQPALPPVEGMQFDVALPKKHSIATRRTKRRRACRDVFLAKKRAEQLEALQSRKTLEVETSAQKAEKQVAEEDAFIEMIFVCRPDIDPPSLVAHLPQLTALYQARQRTAHDERNKGKELEMVEPSPATYLVQLNVGAEAVLCRALNLRRAAVVAVKSSCPDLAQLKTLVGTSAIIEAPWLLVHPSRSTVVEPTAIRHLASHSPIDPKAARQARKADMKDTRQTLPRNRSKRKARD